MTSVQTPHLTGGHDAFPVFKAHRCPPAGELGRSATEEARGGGGGRDGGPAAWQQEQRCSWSGLCSIYSSRMIAPGIPPQFLNAALFRPWPGWTYTYMVIHPFGNGFIFVAVLLNLGRWSAFPSGGRGGLVYGGGVFVVGSLPVYLQAFASFQVSPEVILSWVVQSLAQYVLAGMALGCVADGASVRVSIRLQAPASRVWELLLRNDTFLYITRGIMTYTDSGEWPTRQFSEETTLTIRVRLFGCGPSLPHKRRTKGPGPRAYASQIA